MARSFETADITPDLLLKAYSVGVFPMAESADDPSLFWVEPKARGILPLDGLIVSKRLARTLRSDRFRVRVDHDFEAVVEGCATPTPERRATWINAPIRSLYRDLFRLGHGHSVEVYHGEALVGGLYGVELGGAFFGESMFHRMRDASKVALAHLVARLRAGGFSLLDTQFVTDHLQSLGAVEIARKDYRQRLDTALARPADFLVWPKEIVKSGGEILAALAERPTS